MYQLNWECDSVGEMGTFPKKTFFRPKVFPENGDESATGFRPIGYASGGSCGVPWYGGIEDDTPARNETHSLNDYFLAILCYIYLFMF
jgi:hypothetical protein